MITERTRAGQLGMKTLGGIYPYTQEQVAERRAEIANGLIAVRKTLTRCEAEMPDNKHSKKVYILDGGSLVIDQSQVLWHIDVGTPVRFPVYSVLIEHPDGLFMYDTGYDLDHVNRVLPFEQPRADPGPDHPGAAQGVRLRPRAGQLRGELALPLRPRGRQQVPDQRHHPGQHGGTAARQGPRAVRAPRLLGPVLRFPRHQVRADQRRHRDRRRDLAVRDPGPHRRALLAAGRDGRPAVDDLRGRRGLHLREPRAADRRRVPPGPDGLGRVAAAAEAAGPHARRADLPVARDGPVPVLEEGTELLTRGDK